MLHRLDSHNGGEELEVQEMPASGDARVLARPRRADVLGVPQGHGLGDEGCHDRLVEGGDRLGDLPVEGCDLVCDVAPGVKGAEHVGTVVARVPGDDTHVEEIDGDDRCSTALR